MRTNATVLARVTACIIVIAAASLPALAAHIHGKPVVVPFDPHHDEVTIDASASGTPLRVLVDTGVDPSAIDRSVALQLHLKPVGAEGQIEGAGSGAASAYPTVIPDVKIG